MPTLIVVLKWVAQLLLLATGWWALFGAESTRVDPTTRKRALTPHGWIRVMLLLTGVALFAASDREERASARRRALLAEQQVKQQQETIEILHEQLEYSRRVFLLQFELARFVLRWELDPGDRKRIAADLAPSASERKSVPDLVYLETAFLHGDLSVSRASGDRWQLNVRVNRPLGMWSKNFGQDSPVWRKLEDALVLAFGGCRLQLKNGELLMDVLGRHWPCELHIGGPTLEFVIEKPGLGLWHLESTELFATCLPGRLHMPARARLISEDPKVYLDQMLEFAWKPEAFGPPNIDEDGKEQIVTRLRSRNIKLETRILNLTKARVRANGGVGHRQPD